MLLPRSAPTFGSDRSLLPTAKKQDGNQGPPNVIRSSCRAMNFFRFRKAPAPAADGTHVSHHMCCPWISTCDGLNNGRTLTLYGSGSSWLYGKRADCWGVKAMAGGWEPWQVALRAVSVARIRQCSR